MDDSKVVHITREHPPRAVTEMWAWIVTQANVCNVHFFPRVRDPGETQANLHLIAAAPDLLAACRLADLVFGSWACAEDHPEERNAIALLRAAIARADGKGMSAGRVYHHSAEGAA